tara:strand:- start:15487 stop:15699 length:213 start_codon:yes stop_codon:yes gene_type:complete
MLTSTVLRGLLISLNLGFGMRPNVVFLLSNGLIEQREGFLRPLSSLTLLAAKVMNVRLGYSLLLTEVAKF